MKMKAEAYKLTVNARLILTGRELELLHHVCSYNNNDFIKGMVSSHYHGGVTEQEMKELFDDLRQTTGQLLAKIGEANKHAFIKEDLYV